MEEGDPWRDAALGLESLEAHLIMSGHRQTAGAVGDLRRLLWSLWRATNGGKT